MNNPLKYTDPTGLLWFKIDDKWTYLKDQDEITQVSANKDGTTKMTVVKGVSTGLVFNGTQLTMLRADGSARAFPAVSGVVSGWGEVHPSQQSRPRPRAAPGGAILVPHA